VALNTANASEAPYAPFILAVLMVSVWADRLSSVIAALAGGLMSLRLIRHPSPITWQAEARGLAIFVVLCTVLIIVVEALKDALQREAALNEQLTVVTRELHHRVKNVVTLAISVAQQTGRNTDSTESYREKLTDRLVALGRAQDLLIESGAQAVPLGVLIDQILSPFDAAGHLTAPPSGPAVEVPQELAVSLALLVNELATNATKYGALSLPKGRLDLHWSLREGWTEIDWKEHGGPVVGEPAKTGFGSRLFLSALPRNAGRVDVAFEPDGLRCKIGFASR
jgi:two-component sensor histidine kinase